MANKNFNTQIRKKFDNGTEKPKAKDMLDRNPNRTMSPETKKKVRLAIERSNKQKEARPKKPTRGKPKDNKTERRTKAKQPIQPIEKLPPKKEPLRKPSDRQQRQLRRTKELERRQFGKSSEDKKPKKNTIKDKLNKVGNMKVKDAAKVVGKVILAGTPVGAAKNVTDTFKKNFKFQSPIVSRKNKKFGGK